jgi:enoyl-CoA hydratase/carnithine racemase
MLKRRQQGQVAILTIDRANRRNALGTELMQALSKAFAEIDRDDAVAAVVISATPPGFCAGSDLKELATMDIGQMCAHEAETARVVRAIGFMEKPAIAAVSGFALGGGVGLAAGCDLIVTHPECRWHMPEVPNGWLPPWALASLSVRIGPVAARRLVWASEPITGAEAYHLKLADYLVPLSDVEGEAIALAERLAALPRVAVASTKRFFTPLINGNAEASDMLANRIFAENCQDDASKATLRKFGMKV